jgi:hypothetical protein
LHANLSPLATTIAEEETVSPIVLDSPAVRFTLIHGFRHCSVKICADRQVLARKDTTANIICGEPVRDAAFIFGCVPGTAGCHVEP